jgi:superfamily II DNA or RNA helicase
MEATKALTSKGYAILKHSLTSEQTKRIVTELSVAPLVNKKFAFNTDALSFRVYRESPERYYLPREWAREVFGEPQVNLVPVGDGLREDLQFTGKPYDYQKAIVDTFIEKGGNGLICVPCGRGKTFMAIWTAFRLKKRFVIVVDKEFLLQQWKGELESLLPGIQIGIIQEDKAQIDSEVILGPSRTIKELKEQLRDAGLKVTGTRPELVERLKAAGLPFENPSQTIHYDCTIAMIKTIVTRPFTADAFSKFGFAIFDECHHLGAQHFNKALLKVQTRWMLGLSATPQRDDGLTKVFEMFLGKPVYWEKTRDPDPMVNVRTIYIDCKDSAYTNLPMDWRGELVMGRLLTQVVECAERNDTIAATLREIASDKQRKILVLSERISHLQDLEARLDPKKYSMSYYVGGMKEEVREKGAVESQILLASYAMASEAMNIKTLNCVLLASPRKKVEQSTGRILRVRPAQRTVPPLIVDIVDSHQVYRSQYRKRAVYYRKCKYSMDTGEEGESDDADIRPAAENGCMIIDDDDE